MKHPYNPRVLQCMRFRRVETIGSAPRIVMDYEFDFCVECDRTMWLENECHKIEKGCFVIRKPGQKVFSRGRFDCYMLTLDFTNRSPSAHYSRNTATQMQEPFETELWDVLPSVFKPAHYDDYVQIFEDLLSLNEMDINENDKTVFLVNHLLHLVTADAYANICFAKAHENSPIQEVCAYIKKHYSEKITLDALADVAHLNKNYLVRQFKKVFGVSPIAYLIKIRMDYAKKLLSESSSPIKTVAAECGYTDAAFFNTYFKKTYSVSPAAYRRMQQIDTKQSREM